MEVVPKLKQFSLLTLIETLISEKSPCLSMKMHCKKLIRVMDQGSWGDASICLLDWMVKFYSHKVTPIILEALLPIHAKELHLKKCPLITEECLNSLVNRIEGLKILNLKKNSHFKFNELELFNNSFKNSCKLTTVVLEGCPQVQDENIQALLKNAPFLVYLNIAGCGISDDAFLFNGIHSNVKNYGCKLETVNLSFCKNFTSTGVHQLCLLCGSTLQSIDLFKTKVDCTALLHLSGLGLDEAEQFLNSMRDVTDEELEQKEIFFPGKITNLTLWDLIFKSENVGLLCFQQFLMSNRNVSSLTFYCHSRTKNYITDSVLKLIGDYAKKLKNLTVVNGFHMTTSGIAKLARCKQLSHIELIESDTIEDSAIIELVQNLNLSHIKLSMTSVTSDSLNAMAAKKMPDLLKELEVSWCDELEDDSEGLHNVIRTCRSLEKLHITNCCVTTTTLSLLAAHCHSITELIINCSSDDYSDESFILLSKNVPHLEKINIGSISGLTDRSIRALLSNCKLLNNIYLDKLGITSEPFLQLISVPEELNKYLMDKVNKFMTDKLKEKIRSHKINLSDFNIELSELPRLPHRSMVYWTELKKMYVFDCPLVEEEKLQQVAAVVQGSIKANFSKARGDIELMPPAINVIAAMEVVPTLKHFSILSLVECLVSEKSPSRVMKMQWLNLIRQLDQGSWGDASTFLLDRMVKFYSQKITPIILEALLPINAKELHLKKCPLVTEESLNKIVNRCKGLKILNLTKNLHFKFNDLELFNISFKNCCNLTTVVLEGCPQVQDQNIQALLKNAPFLVSLNISFCDISDDAFLLNGIPSNVNKYECKLEKIDLRFCKNFSNTGVHHLCSLCGSTLQFIDLYNTKIDSIALLYLSGFGLDEAEQFLNSMRDVTDQDYEQTEIFFHGKITNLILRDLIFQAQQRALPCFQQFLRANRNVSILKFYCLSRSKNYITDNVLKLIGDHAQNLKSLTVVRGLNLTTSGIARLAQCKQITSIDFVDCKKVEDSTIIELVQKLNLSHIKLCSTSVTSDSLNAIAAKNMPDLLKELDVCWCADLEDDSEGLHNVIKTCRSLEKLQITNCCVSTTTLNLLAVHCHSITELYINCSTDDFSDESFILLSKNVRLLEKIELGSISGLTDKSIKALLSNCKRLSYIYLDRLGITSEPFLQLISVPDELKNFLMNEVNTFLTDELKEKIRSHKVNLSDFNIGLSVLPCLPHRSMTYCTELKKMYVFCPLVEEEELQKVASVVQGSIKIASESPFDLQGSSSSMERLIEDQIILISKDLPGF